MTNIKLKIRRLKYDLQDMERKNANRYVQQAKKVRAQINNLRNDTLCNPIPKRS